jgi:hypothetical protein
VAAFRIYQGVHDERSRAALAPQFEALDIRPYVGNPYYEFAIMRDLLRKEVDGAWGLVSWKFTAKTAVPAAEFWAFVERSLPDHDVVFINPMLFWEAAVLNVWEQGEMAHPGLVGLAAALTRFRALDRLIMKRGSFAYCQYFVAKRPFWEAYLAYLEKTVIGRFEAAKADDPIVPAMLQPAGHHNNPAASRIPFLIERLFSTFLLANPDIRAAAFPHSAEVYRRKFGPECGGFLHALSDAKESIGSYGDAAHERWHRLRSVILDCYRDRPLATLDDPPV